jgi:sRNA-binding carbon storage regulator CsrA
MHNPHPVLILAVRANHSIRNGHVKLCIYAPHAYGALREEMEEHINSKEKHNDKKWGLDEGKIRLRELEDGVLLDINIQAHTVKDGILSVFPFTHIPAEISTEDGHGGLVRAFAAIPVTEEEVRGVLRVLYGKPFDYNLLSKTQKGNNCVTMPKRALEAVSIGLYAALGLEEHAGWQRPQSVADAILSSLQQATDTMEMPLDSVNPPVSITMAEQPLEKVLWRNLWVGHTEGHKHVPVHEVVRKLEAEDILRQIGLSDIRSDGPASTRETRDCEDDEISR